VAATYCKLPKWQAEESCTDLSNFFSYEGKNENTTITYTSNEYEYCIFKLRGGGLYALEEKMGGGGLERSGEGEVEVRGVVMCVCLTLIGC
jgi:hypothetical protein